MIKSSESDELLNDKVVTISQAQKMIDASLDEARDLKKDILTSFGIFAALLTFASLEVSILSNVHRFSLMIGMSAFFLSSMMFFVLGLHTVFTDRNNNWSDYKKPVFLISGGILIFSFLCFAYAFLLPSGWGLKIFNLQ